MESIHELLANDLVNASVPICWETHITAFNSSGGTDIFGGVAGDMCWGGTENQGEHISPLHWSTLAINVLRVRVGVYLINYS